MKFLDFNVVKELFPKAKWDIGYISSTQLNICANTPIKWKFPRLAKELDKVEQEVMKDLGVDIILKDYEKVMLKMADMMELLWFCVEEERRGNRNFKEVFIRGTKFLQDLFTTDHKMNIIYQIYTKNMKLPFNWSISTNI